MMSFHVLNFFITVQLYTQLEFEQFQVYWKNVS